MGRGAGVPSSSPSDITVGHMMEAKKPMQGKATREASAGPNRATDSMHNAPSENPINTRRLSKSFNKPIPSRQPAVMSPQ